MKNHTITQDFSGTGYCFDNVRMESFFYAKERKVVPYTDLPYNEKEVKTVILLYVFTYYNDMRVYIGNTFGLSSVKYREWLMRLTGKPVA